MEKFDVLFVDDDRQFLAIIKAVFNHHDINICCAESGEEALDIIKEAEFKLMVTDLTMTGMNGLELTKRTREIVPSLPIVLLTGDIISSEISALAANLGIFMILGKPVNMRVLLDIVRGV